MGDNEEYQDRKIITRDDADALCALSTHAVDWYAAPPTLLRVETACSGAEQLVDLERLADERGGIGC